MIDGTTLETVEAAVEVFLVVMQVLFALVAIIVANRGEYSRATYVLCFVILLKLST